MLTRMKETGDFRTLKYFGAVGGHTTRDTNALIDAINSGYPLTVSKPFNGLDYQIDPPQISGKANDDAKRFGIVIPNDFYMEMLNGTFNCMDLSKSLFRLHGTQKAKFVGLVAKHNVTDYTAYEGGVWQPLIARHDGDDDADDISFIGGRLEKGANQLIRSQGGSNWRIEGMYFGETTTVTVYLANTTRCKVNDCDFMASGDDNIQLAVGCDYSEINGGTFYGAGTIEGQTAGGLDIAGAGIRVTGDNITINAPKIWNYSAGGIVFSSNGSIPDSLPENIVVNGGYIGEFNQGTFNHNNVGSLVFKNVGNVKVNNMTIRNGADKTDSADSKYSAIRVFSGNVGTLAQSGTISCTDMDIKGAGYLVALNDDGCTEFELTGRFENYRFPIYANTSTGTIDRIRTSGYFKGSNGNHIMQAHPSCSTINKLVLDGIDIGSPSTGSAAVNLGSDTSDILGELVIRGDSDFNGNTKYGNNHANCTIIENSA